MKRFWLLYLVMLAPGVVTAFAAVPTAGADWTALADRQLWGVLISIVAASLAALGILAALMVRLMNLLARVGEQNEKRQAEAIALSRDMGIVITKNAEAMTRMIDAVKDLVHVVEDCKLKKS